MSILILLNIMTTIEFTHQIAGLRSMLHGFTRRFTLDREEAHDLVQDTMLKAIINREKFRENTNLRGWLFTIMRNTFINNYRKNRRRRKVSDQAKEFIFQSTEDKHTFSRPHASLEYRDIWNNVDDLRDELRAPFKMNCTGYKYQEIADHLGIPLGTVKNRIFHARKEIQKRLHGY
jgi:RNA polymerase sigma-70 factor (ECF subfamily)